MIGRLFRLMATGDVVGPLNLGNSAVTMLELAQRVLELTGAPKRLIIIPPAGRQSAVRAA